jgi:hypothetical protein
MNNHTGMAWCKAEKKKKKKPGGEYGDGPAQCEGCGSCTKTTFTNLPKNILKIQIKPD